MLFTFGMSLVSFSLLFFALLRARYRLAVTLEALQAEDAPETSPVRTLRAEPAR
jgi:hypothetical protein